MKKKYKYLLGLLCFSLTLLTINVFIFSSNHNSSKADETTFVLEFNESKNQILDWNNLPIPAKSQNGNDINFKTNSAYNVSSNWICLSNVNSYIENVTPISGIKSISIQFNNSSYNPDDIPLYLYWGYEESFKDDSKYFYGGFKANNEVQTYEFQGSFPSYFRIYNLLASGLDIKKMEIIYSCKRSISPDVIPISFDVVSNNITCEVEKSFKERKNDIEIDVLFSDNSHFVFSPTRYGISDDYIFEDENSYVTILKTEIYFSYNGVEISDSEEKADIYIYNYRKLFPTSLLPLRTINSTKCLLRFDPHNNKAYFYYFDDELGKYVYNENQALVFTGAIAWPDNHYSYGLGGSYNNEDVVIGINMFYNTNDGYADGYIGSFKFSKNESLLKNNFYSPIASVSDIAIPKLMSVGSSRIFNDDLSFDKLYACPINLIDPFLCGVSYETSDASIISIDNNGKYTALQFGEATIKATFNILLGDDIIGEITFSKVINTYNDNIPQIYKDYPSWQTKDHYEGKYIFYAKFFIDDDKRLNVNINFANYDILFFGQLYESTSDKQLFQDANNNYISFQETSDKELKVIETNIDYFKYLINETIIPFIYRLLNTFIIEGQDVWVNNQLEDSFRSDLIFTFNDNSTEIPFKEDTVTISKNNFVIADELPLTYTKDLLNYGYMVFSNDFCKIQIEVNKYGALIVNVLEENTDIIELNYLFVQGADSKLYDNNLLPDFYRLNPFFKGQVKDESEETTYIGKISFDYRFSRATASVELISNTGFLNSIHSLDNCVFSSLGFNRIKLYLNDENYLVLILLGNSLHFIKEECLVNAKYMNFWFAFEYDLTLDIV